MGIDLRETTTADTSHAFNMLVSAVQAITPESVRADPEHGMVSITRADDVIIRVALAYDDDERYAGLEIIAVNAESTPGSWIVWCELEDLPRFLPAVLTRD